MFITFKTAIGSLSQYLLQHTIVISFYHKQNRFLFLSDKVIIVNTIVKTGLRLHLIICHG